MARDSQPQVYLVDDDPDVRAAIGLLLQTENFRISAFENAQGLLDAVDEMTPGCALLDVRLPDMDGLSLQREMRHRGIRMPVIFITGHGDIPMAVRAVNEGALDFLEKPFRDDSLIEAVRHALVTDEDQRAGAAETMKVEQRLATLTPRERQVLEGLLDGKPSKLIAWDLEVSVRTIEIHRGNLMQKMGAKSASHLARLALACSEFRDYPVSG